MDDFCHVFYGGPDGQPVIRTYTFEDLVATLNGIAPYDWTAFFRARLDSTEPGAPLGGITGGGWKLVYNDEPNEILSAGEAGSGSGNFTASIDVYKRQNGNCLRERCHKRAPAKCPPIFTRT